MELLVLSQPIIDISHSRSLARRSYHSTYSRSTCDTILVTANLHDSLHISGPTKFVFLLIDASWTTHIEHENTLAILRALVGNLHLGGSRMKKRNFFWIESQ